jgi:hypothetical protein
MQASYAQETELGTRPRPSRRAQLGDGVVCQDASAAYPTLFRIDRRACYTSLQPSALGADDADLLNSCLTACLPSLSRVIRTLFKRSGRHGSHR